MKQPLSLAEFLPYRFSELAERISQSLSRIYVEQFDISISQWRILATLAEYGKLQAKQVVRLTNMDKVKVSRAVSSLCERDLLQRSPCPQDSRATDLGLSPAGRRLYRRIAPRALAWEQELTAGLSEEERGALFRIIDKLDRQLSKGVPGEAGS